LTVLLGIAFMLFWLFFPVILAFFIALGVNKFI
jgi:hypothetical protein